MRYLGLVAVLVVLVAACGDSGDEAADESGNGTSDDAQEAVTIEVWFNGTPEEHGGTLEELVEEYEAQNTHVTVDWEILSWDVFQERVATAAAGGTLPDIVFTHSTALPAWAEQGIVTDHSQYLDPEDFLAIGVELTTWDDVWSGIPYWISSNVLTYRKDLAEDAGLDPDDPPANWDELRRWAEAMTVEEDGQVQQLGFTVHQGVSQHITTLFFGVQWSNGGFMFSEDGCTVTLNDQHGVEAAQLIQDLFEYDEPGAIEAQNIALGQGRLAMVFSNHALRWDAEFPELLEQEMGAIVPFPAGPSATEDHGYVSAGADTIAITEASQNKEEAAKFLEFITVDPDNAVAMVEHANAVPGSRATAGHPYFEENPYVGTTRELLTTYGQIPPKHPQIFEFLGIFNAHMDDLTLEGKDPQAALDDMTAEIQTAVDESGVCAQQLRDPSAVLAQD